MRFIDIDLLERSLAWDKRAAKALRDLRTEIAAAEASAIASGDDPGVARRKAISEGLDKASRKNIWRQLAPKLKGLSHRKCWYSESIDPTADRDVDHFRPKSRVAEDASHEGYWWLAFNWRNYRYSSQWCNQRRAPLDEGTDGGKWDHFPVRGVYRARRETEDWTREKPMLLDPVDPDDWLLLTFRPDGHPTPAKDRGTVAYERARVSIAILHLNCRELVIARMQLAGRIRRCVEEMEHLQPRIAETHSRAVYKSIQVELLRAIDKTAPYSAAALAYARAEVYVDRAGALVKRTWLEDILSSRT